MRWSIEDSNTKRHELNQILEYIESYKDSKTDLEKIINAYGEICYNIGYERGYKHHMQFNDIHDLESVKPDTEIARRFLKTKYGKTDEF